MLCDQILVILISKIPKLLNIHINLYLHYIHFTIVLDLFLQLLHKKLTFNLI